MTIQRSVELKLRKTRKLISEKSKSKSVLKQIKLGEKQRRRGRILQVKMPLIPNEESYSRNLL